jgi:hypothetical protein
VKSKSSTRFSIVQQALADAIERLGDLPLTPQVRDLRAKALSFDRAIRSWKTHPPSEATRSTLTKQVIELTVEVMQLARDMQQMK